MGSAAGHEPVCCMLALGWGTACFRHSWNYSGSVFLYVGRSTSASAHCLHNLSLELARNKTCYCNPTSPFLLFHAHQALSAGRGDVLLGSLGRLKMIYINGKYPCYGPWRQLMSKMLYTGRRRENCQNRSNLSPRSCFASPFQSWAPRTGFTAWPETPTKMRFPFGCVMLTKTKEILFSCGEGGEKGLGRKPFQDWDFLTRYSAFFQNYCTLVGTSTAVTGMAVRWKTPQPVCSSTTIILRISCEQLLPL